MRTRTKVLIGLFAAVLVLSVGALVRFRYQYPYGHTHRCSRLLILALIFHAEEHGGKYPAGEATPEASFSLLYREQTAPADFLAGRAKSEKEVEDARKILESGGLLGPDTCDWHYVEGLTRAAPATIALFWGKSDLGHTGQRLHGGHEVAFNDGHIEVIPASRWQAFLTEQEKLVTECRKQKEKKSEPAPP